MDAGIIMRSEVVMRSVFVQRILIHVLSQPSEAIKTVLCFSNNGAPCLLTVSFERLALTSSVWFIHKTMDLHKATSMQQASMRRSISGRYILCLHGNYSSFFLTVHSPSRQRTSILNFSYYSYYSEEVGELSLFWSVIWCISRFFWSRGWLNQLFCPVGA